MSSVQGQTKENVIPILSSSPTATNKNPNIKRNIQLYRYGKSSLLGSKGWKAATAIIYDDSMLKIFKELDGHRKMVQPILLEDVILDVAFGKAATKYDPPPITGDEKNFITPDNFIAVPETKERKKIHWFAAKDEHNLNEIMQAIGESVAGKVRPPSLGKGMQGRYFNQDETEKWITYWKAQQRNSETIAEENGDRKGKPATVDNSPKTAFAAGSPKMAAVAALPTSPAKQHPISSSGTVGMPGKVEILRLESDNLRDETQSDTITVVRLVGGKRIKENVTRKPSHQRSPILGGYSTATATVVPIQQRQGDENNGKPYNNSPIYKSEHTFISTEPHQNMTTNINIGPNPNDHFSQHQQREEIVTGNEKTVINVGSSERSFSNVENSNDGVTYTTTKQSSYHRSTVTTSND